MGAVGLTSNNGAQHADTSNLASAVSNLRGSCVTNTVLITGLKNIDAQYVLDVLLFLDGLDTLMNKAHSEDTGV